jgi:hypothetical protein
MKKWIVIYAIERVVELDADNINDASDRADREKRSGERIVSIRTR